MQTTGITFSIYIDQGRFPTLCDNFRQSSPISTTKKDVSVYKTISDKVVATKLNSR